ncbi:MAG: tetratricopeptide repeat protein [Nitrospirae bacterium]|nr:tetratricopeptide repeat protein [Nitrospirota bacterium]
MQRFASLAAFFYLLSLVAYIKSRLMAEGDKPKDKFLRIFFYGISFISAVLAMKTKENAFTLPLIITLYEFCFFTPPQDALSSERRLFRQQRLKYLLPVLLTMSIIPLTLMFQSGTVSPPPESYSNKFTGTEYRLTQLRVIVTYLRLLFYPANQNFFYEYPVFHSFHEPAVALSFLFLAGLFGIAVFLIIRNKQAGSTVHRLIGFGMLWFFVTLSVESVIPLWMLINEYRVYLPSVGIFLAAVSGLYLASARNRRLTFFLLSLVIMSLSLAAHFRNELYRNKIALWEDTVRKSPGIAAAHNTLGKAYMEHNMPKQALEQFLVAVKLRPALEMAHNNLGNAYMALSMADKAEGEYLTAIRLKPDYADAHNNLGVYYLNRDKPAKAVEQFLLAIKLKPDFAEVYNNLGVYYFNHGEPAKAVGQFLPAIKLKPDFAEVHNNLGNSYRALNMHKEAFRQYIMAVRLKPDYAEAHLNLGVIFYQAGRRENARKEFEEVLKLQPDNMPAKQLLAKVSS